MKTAEKNITTASLAFTLAPNVHVKISSSRPEILRYFAAEYGRAAAEKDGEEYGVEVTLDDFDAQTSRDNWLQLTGRHKTISWRVAVSDIDEPVSRLAFSGHGEMAISFLQTFYLEPLVRLKVFQAGSSLVHGCTIVYDGSSYLLTGGSGVGKTTIALQHALAGLPVQGDNYVVVTEKGETLTYPRRMRLYADLIKNNAQVFELLSAREKLALRMNSAIKAASRGFANMPRRIPLHDIFPDLPQVQHARLGKLVLLTRADDQERLEAPTPISMDDFIERTIETNEAEFFRLAPLVEPYAKNHASSILNRSADQDRELLHAATRGLSAVEILIPRTKAPALQAAQISNLLCR